MASNTPKSPLTKLLLTLALIPLLLGVLKLFISDSDESKATYIPEKGSAFFNLTSKDIEKVKHLVVVSKSYYTNKDVIIRFHGDDFATIYSKVNAEGFHDFNERIIKPYLEENPELSIAFLNSLKGVGAHLGIDGDPTKEILKAKGSGMASSLTGILSLAFTFFLIFLMLMMLQGNLMKNNIKPVMPDEIDDEIDELVGMDDIKSELLQLQEMILNRELYQGYGISKAFNVMMTGPAGTGKTKTARCLAKQIDCPLYYISASSLETGFVGGGAKTLRSMHKKASKHERAIIFLDEAESVFRSRKAPTHSRHENDTMNALLSLLDGVNTNKSGEVIWIVASNFDEHKMDMDEAMLRRFHLKVNFRLPNLKERSEIIKRLFAKKETEALDQDLNIEHIATITSGMSPAILETLVARAALIAIQEKKKISQDIALKAFERVAVGLTDRATSGDIDSKRKIIAIHESGHFIAQLHHALIKSDGDLEKLPENLHVLKISTEAVSSVGALGFVLSKGEELPLPSRRDMEEQIVELYGGVANEELFLGESGVTAGAHNDIQKVTRMLSLMFNEVGYYTSAKLNFVTLKESGLDATRQRISEITSRAETLYNYTVELLQPYKPMTEMITDELMECFTINQNRIMDIVCEYFEQNPDQLLAYQKSEVRRPAYTAAATTS